MTTYDELAEYTSFWINCDECGELAPADDFDVKDGHLYHSDHLAREEDKVDEEVQTMLKENDQAYEAYRAAEEEPGYAQEDRG